MVKREFRSDRIQKESRDTLPHDNSYKGPESTERLTRICPYIRPPRERFLRKWTTVPTFESPGVGVQEEEYDSMGVASLYMLSLNSFPGKVVLAGTRAKQKKLARTARGQTQPTIRAA